MATRNICFRPKTPSFSTSNSSPAISVSESSIDRCIEAAEALITKWNPETSPYAKVTSLFYDNKSEAMRYIKSVNNLHKAMRILLSRNPAGSSHKLNLANNLMQTAMKTLQKEFYQILSVNRDHLDPESISTTTSSISLLSTTTSDDVDDATAPDHDVRAAGDSISELEQVSFVAMRDLRSIAECMNSCGYAKDCADVYRVIRKSIINEGIYRLSLEKLSSSQVNRMDWQVVELKIKIWLEAVKVAVRTLFNGERILCDNVFATSDSMRECCFTDISSDGAAVVFAFPDLVVSKTKKSPPEKMFRLLDMYTVLIALLPEIQSIFSFNSTSEILSQVHHSLLRISESVRTMLLEFESTIQKESSKPPVRGGGVQPLTSQAMEYLSLLAGYTNILCDIFADWPLPPKPQMPEHFLDSPDSDEISASPAFSARIAWLILLLLCKLDSKTKHCKDASLSYLFLANNLQPVIGTVRDSNLQYFLGDEWVAKREARSVDEKIRDEVREAGLWRTVFVLAGKSKGGDVAGVGEGRIQGLQLPVRGSISETEFDDGIGPETSRCDQRVDSEKNSADISRVL